MLSEFDLIKQYFDRPRGANGRVSLGIGDDCALLMPAPGMDLAVSTDMLVEGRHFFAGADPESLGHKSLAVNLSDLAAMGATPVAFTLALALPAAQPEWLAAFSRGLFALADLHHCSLIGGDTTRGPLTVCITVFGEVPPGLALRRDAARPGDDVWVSGTLGDARLALAAHRNDTGQGDCANQLVLADGQLPMAELRLHRPSPRVGLGIALRGIAPAAIDISDGFGGDLWHILERSGCGATIDVDTLPAGPVLQSQPVSLRRAWTIAGGDDYELCFTAPPERRLLVHDIAAAAGTPVTRVGRIDAATGLRFQDTHGMPVPSSTTSFDHFRGT